MCTDKPARRLERFKIHGCSSTVRIEKKVESCDPSKMRRCHPVPFGILKRNSLPGINIANLQRAGNATID